MGWLTGEKSKVQFGRMDRWSPEQWDLLKSTLKPYLQEPAEAYQGQLSTGLSGLEETSLKGIEDWVKEFRKRDSLLRQSQQAVLGTLQRGPTDFNEYYRTAIQEPMLRDFQRDILPAISREYAPSGFYSSERERADERAREELLKALGQSRAQLGYQARENALNRVLEAAGVIPGLVGSEEAGLVQALSAGAVPRTVKQDALARAYQEWQRQQTAQAGRMAQILQALGISPYENFAVAMPGRSGALQGALGGLAQGATTAAAAALLAPPAV